MLWRFRSDLSEEREFAGQAALRSVRAEQPGTDSRPPTADTIPRPAKSPLITAVAIENFKGIGGRITIELRPVTLLFGRNSAGKSTVLHALCYAHEILSHGDIDAHKTGLGGDQIDLGGFRRFVHGHDLSRAVYLRFDLNLRHRRLPEFLDEGNLPANAETGWLALTVKMVQKFAKTDCRGLRSGCEWKDSRSHHIIPPRLERR